MENLGNNHADHVIRITAFTLMIRPKRFCSLREYVLQKKDEMKRTVFPILTDFRSEVV